MKLTLIFILTVSFHPLLAATSSYEKLPMSSSHYQPGLGEIATGLEFSYSYKEVEFETDTEVLEQFESRHFSVLSEYIFGLSDRHLINIGITYSDFGKLTKEYDGQFDLDPVDTTYRGFKSLTFAFQTRFTNLLNHNIDQSLSMRIESGVFDAKDTNAAQGGTDFYASYLFSFYHRYNFEFYGALETAYIGKRETKRIDGEIEKSDTYAKSTLDVGIANRTKGFFISADGGFGLTTNYNVSSASYSRETDKGFILRGQIKLGYETENFLIQGSFITRSDVFNKIVEDIEQADPTLDYEWESNFASIKVIWKY